ncbi:hypothetical protein ACWGID_00465 [Kribbella sp. NPDC054772]
MRTEVQNQIRMLGNAVVAEVAKRRDSHRRWLRLAPVDGGVRLLEVEVPVGVDPANWPRDEEDYVVVSEETFASLDDALSILERRGIDTNAFDAVWKTENPF